MNLFCCNLFSLDTRALHRVTQIFQAVAAYKEGKLGLVPIPTKRFVIDITLVEVSNSGLSEVPVHISVQQLLSKFCGWKILFKCTITVSTHRRVNREMGSWGGEGKQSGVLLCGHDI